MLRGANDEFTLLILPQTVATGATATGILDCINGDFAQVHWAGDTAATNPAVLKLGEGDTTSAFTDIGVFTGDDTTDGFTIPAVDTSNGVQVVMNVDLRKRKRYLQLSCNPGASQVMSATGRVGRKKSILATAADMGVDAVVEG
jgi:hypothetical protein